MEKVIALLKQYTANSALPAIGITDIIEIIIITMLVYQIIRWFKSSRAWTIVKGTKAPGAAGKIHSDFERGFIRAEVIGYDELIEAGSMTAAKEKGWVRSEGKEYVVKDGDIILFRFNV